MADNGNKDQVVLRLAYRPPYDWFQVRRFLAARALPGVERVDEHGYARTLAMGERYGSVCVRPVTGEGALELRVRGAAPGDLFQLSAAARRAFDLAADPALIARAFRSDLLLAPLVHRRPGLRIPRTWDAFECAVRAIVGQQVSVAAGCTLVGRLIARLGRPVSYAEEGLTHLFPTPAALATGDLDGLGLTRSRIGALRALAQAVVSGELDFADATERVRQALSALPGVGEWTVQYVALRALGEPDSFPASDLVLRRMASTDGAPLATRALEARAEAWRPWRSYASMHLWCKAADSGSKGIRRDTSPTLD